MLQNRMPSMTMLTIHQICALFLLFICSMIIAFCPLLMLRWFYKRKKRRLRYRFQQQTKSTLSSSFSGTLPSSSAMINEMALASTLHVPLMLLEMFRSLNGGLLLASLFLIQFPQLRTNFDTLMNSYVYKSQMNGNSYVNSNLPQPEPIRIHNESSIVSDKPEHINNDLFETSTISSALILDQKQDSRVAAAVVDDKNFHHHPTNSQQQSLVQRFSPIPIVEVILCLAFFTLYFIEEFTQLCFRYRKYFWACNHSVVLSSSDGRCDYTSLDYRINCTKRFLIDCSRKTTTTASTSNFSSEQGTSTSIRSTPIAQPMNVTVNPLLLQAGNLNLDEPETKDGQEPDKTNQGENNQTSSKQTNLVDNNEQHDNNQAKYDSLTFANQNTETNHKNDKQSTSVEVAVDGAGDGQQPEQSSSDQIQETEPQSLLSNSSAHLPSYYWHNQTNNHQNVVHSPMTDHHHHHHCHHHHQMHHCHHYHHHHHHHHHQMLPYNQQVNQDNQNQQQNPNYPLNLVGDHFHQHQPEPNSLFSVNFDINEDKDNKNQDSKIKNKDTKIETNPEAAIDDVLPDDDAEDDAHGHPGFYAGCCCCCACACSYYHQQQQMLLLNQQDILQNVTLDRGSLKSSSLSSSSGSSSSRSTNGGSFTKIFLPNTTQATNIPALYLGEGLLIGVQSSAPFIWLMLFIMLAHKFVSGLLMATELHQKTTGRQRHLPSSTIILFTTLPSIGCLAVIVTNVLISWRINLDMVSMATATNSNGASIGAKLIHSDPSTIPLEYAIIKVILVSLASATLLHLIMMTIQHRHYHYWSTMFNDNQLNSSNHHENSKNQNSSSKPEISGQQNQRRTAHGTNKYLRKRNNKKTSFDPGTTTNSTLMIQPSKMNLTSSTTSSTNSRRLFLNSFMANQTGASTAIKSNDNPTNNKQQSIISIDGHSNSIINRHPFNNCDLENTHQHNYHHHHHYHHSITPINDQSTMVGVDGSIGQIMHPQATILPRTNNVLHYFTMYSGFIIILMAIAFLNIKNFKL